MVNLALKQEIIKNISMNVNIEQGTNLELEIKFSFNVNYVNDNKTCVADLRQEVTKKDDPTKFRIVVEGLGVFDVEGINGDEDKKVAHVQAYQQIFPYVRNMIRTLTMEAGLPPLVLQPIKMTPENVRVGGTQNAPAGQLN